MYRYALPTVAVVVILVILGAGLAAWQFVSIKSTGLPLGAAMRVPGAIVQIINTQERYLPSLHRNPAKDRFRLDLLVVSISDPSQQDTIMLLRQQKHGVMQPMTKILGADGDVVWLNAMGVMGVNLKTKRVIKGSELERVNPELSNFLPTARFDFEDRLVAISPDMRQAYSFAPDTLRASQCEVPSRKGGMHLPFNDKPDAFLCSGGMLTTTNWFAVRSEADLKNNFAPGHSLPREFPVNTKSELRRLFFGTMEMEERRPRIVTMERASDGDYRDAMLMRDATETALLKLSAPESLLMLYRPSPALFAPFTLVRLAPEGKFYWSVETGIGRLNQVLPDGDIVALIGERPPVPDKVPEPILVFINTATRETNTVSLWRR